MKGKEEHKILIKEGAEGYWEEETNKEREEAERDWIEIRKEDLWTSK